MREDYCESFWPADDYEAKIDTIAVERARTLGLVGVTDDSIIGNTIHVNLTRRGRQVLGLPSSSPVIDFFAKLWR